MQAFADVQEEQARLKGEDIEHEDSAGGDAEDEEDDAHSSGKKTPSLPSARFFQYVNLQKRRLISFHCSLSYES